DQLLVTHGNYSCFLAITEYHQQAVDLSSPINHEWCTYYLNSGSVLRRENLVDSSATASCYR
ncbi:hypothetical protein, partial [Pseudoalteromonas peptidolytica]|uniref:hypothetical protein n=1 Tax=Pseudoalteromonas peptidolytica TaxID=61150 RepID=UPI001B3B296B